MSRDKTPVVEAAGGVLWREAAAGREVAIVHRPRYDDWSLPKGKRKSGEELLLTGVREVTEETGHLPQVGPYLGQYSYSITAAGRPAVKTVKYWAMQTVGGSFEPNEEVDEVAWVSATEAADRSRFPIDRQVLAAFNSLPARTGVLLVVRNASAVRASRKVAPQDRGLDGTGRQQADALVPVLDTLGIETLVTSGARRCAETLEPYAATIEADISADAALRGEGDGDQQAAVARLLALVDEGRRVAVCTEGALTSGLLATIGAALGAVTPRQPTLRKGGWCLLHVGAGELLSIDRQEAA